MGDENDKSIRISDEMIDAGCEILRDYHWGEDDAREFTEKIWIAMERAKPRCLDLEKAAPY